MKTVLVECIGIGMAAGLALSGCGSSSPEVSKGQSRSAFVDEHNAELRTERQAEFTELTTELQEAVHKIPSSIDPRMTMIKKLATRGLEYAEPSDDLVNGNDGMSKKIKFIPYLPQDAELGYADWTPFQQQGAAHYIAGDSEIVVADKFPADLQESTMVHELDHAADDIEGTVGEVSCENVEPEALLIQAKIFPYLFNKPVVTELNKVVPQVDVSGANVEYGDPTQVNQLVDDYSSDQSVRGMFSLVSQYYVTYEAFVADDSATADKRFMTFAAGNYCTRVGLQ